MKSVFFLVGAALLLALAVGLPPSNLFTYLTQAERDFCYDCVAGPTAILVLPRPLYQEKALVCTSFPPANFTWVAYTYIIHPIDSFNPFIPREYTRDRISHPRPGGIWNAEYVDDIPKPPVVGPLEHKKLFPTLSKLRQAAVMFGGELFLETYNFNSLFAFLTIFWY